MTIYFVLICGCGRLRVQNDGDATADRNRRRQIDDQDYDGEEEERDEMGDKSESDGDSGSEYEGRAGGGDDDDDDQVLDASMIHRKKNREKRRSGKEVTMDEARINGVLQLVRLAVDYKYDAVDELWSEVTFELPLSSSSKFDMTSVVELMARSTVVWETSQIKRGYLSQNKMAADPTAVTLKTEGVNIQEMLKHDDILDLNKLYSNDIHAIANSYGIEAAGRVIVKELRSVFAAYGIDVNYRHLSLIADYMTFEGHYKPFNRMAMESSASPLQKMTFETAMHFIKSATLSGAHDNLQSPSSRLVVGQPVYGGTGCFQLNQPLSKI